MQSTEPTTFKSNLSENFKEMCGEIYMGNVEGDQHSLESTLEALTLCCSAVRAQDDNNSNSNSNACNNFNSNSNPRDFQVVRGLADTDFGRMKNGEVYDGGIYRNEFKVFQGPIILQSVGFFGPLEREGEYTIKIIVEEPLFELNYYSCYCCTSRHKRECQCTCKVYGFAKQKVKCDKGELMFIPFPEPILIKENKWYGLNFSIQLHVKEFKRIHVCFYAGFWILKGEEKTARMKEGKQRTEVEVKVGENEDEKRIFAFTMGSCQMPIIRFTLP